MRISDWSSDVCSSDLRHHVGEGQGQRGGPGGLHHRRRGCVVGADAEAADIGGGRHRRLRPDARGRPRRDIKQDLAVLVEYLLIERAGEIGQGLGVGDRGGEEGQRRQAEGWMYLQRSEEHTSELQSLMRISYAVFCLKKKKN